MADRQGERVGGVGRAGRGGHPQQPRHHHRDLVLVGPAAGRVPSWRDQVASGLVNLGWSARDADAAVDAVEADAGDQTPDVATALRAALRKLSRQ